VFNPVALGRIREPENADVGLVVRLNQLLINSVRMPFYKLQRLASGMFEIEKPIAPCQVEQFQSLLLESGSKY